MGPAGIVYTRSSGIPATLAGTGVGFVYVAAKDGNGPVKVGIATNARRRVMELENAGGQRFPLIWVSDVCATFTDIERQAHAYMRPARLVGEWFDVSFDFAITLRFSNRASP